MACIIYNPKHNEWICGLHPFNSSSVDDRRMAPSKAFHPYPVPPMIPIDQEAVEKHANSSLSTSGTNNQSEDLPSLSSSPIFTHEQENLYQKRYMEVGYDLADPSFVAWLRINHPKRAISVADSSSDTCTCISALTTTVTETSRSLSDTLKEILVLPNPPVAKRKRKGINSKTICITDMLDEMKEKEKKKAEEKKEKNQEREEKRKKNLRSRKLERKRERKRRD